MSISAWGLTTVARFKAYIKKTTNEDDTLIETIINIVSDLVERYCDRRFLQTTYTDEYYDGTGSNRMLLKQYPVDSATTVVIDERSGDFNSDSWNSLDSDLFHVDLITGLIELIGARFAEVPRKYRIDYKAGYAFKNNAAPLVTLEAVEIGDLELAVWMLVNNIYQSAKSQTGIKSESIGNYSVSYADEKIMTVEIKLILNKYKRPHLM